MQFDGDSALQHLTCIHSQVLAPATLAALEAGVDGLALRLARYFEVSVEVVFSTEPFPRIGAATRDVA